MNNIVWTEDVINIIRKYVLENEKESSVLIALGSDILNVSEDTMIELIYED